MHFGLEGIVGLVLYVSFIGASLLSAFWRPITGIYFLLPLIPLQTIRYRMNEFPLGGSMIGIILVAVAIGVLRQGGSVLPKTPWTRLLLVYMPYTFLTLCFGSFYLDKPFPLPGDPRFGVWQDYMTLPALLLMVAAIRPTPKQIKTMVLIMCFATLILNKGFWDMVSGRDFSAYNEELREGGNMGYAGTNGLAAFEAQFATLMIALGSFERKFWFRAGYYFLGVFSAICLMYSLSRGGYAAFMVGWVYLGIVKQRKLLVFLVIFLLTWAGLVPQAVQQRVLMSYDKQSGKLDHSAETRLELWDDAFEVFKSSPIVGTGYNTYAYMHRNKGAYGGSAYYEDTHNIYVKVLLETGIIGIFLFIWLLAKTFFTGFRLFWRGKDPFFASLGLGLSVWVLCAAVANSFGDRWTFFQVSGYMWVLAGLVSEALVLERARAEKAAEEGEQVFQFDADGLASGHAPS
jgi:putative inorganic carbon (HCO3(-)) transporter